MNLRINFNTSFTDNLKNFFRKYQYLFLILGLSFLSIVMFVYYNKVGLGLAYNDARSHLDIARRVVEGLKPGIAQLGSVWLPLPHILMIPTVWNDFMWHTGLAGALPSMVSYVVTSILIYQFLKELGVGVVGRLTGLLIFAFNLNVLYLQSTAMTELLLMATMTAACFELYKWHRNDDILQLIKASFYVMLATLIRYDGWFLLAYSTLLVVLKAFKQRGYKSAEGKFFLFCTMAGFGIFLWLVWNWVIFKDPLYFAFGPFSAHSQQQQLEAAGVLATKKNLPLSATIYTYSLAYNSIAMVLVLGLIGAVMLLSDKKLHPFERIASTSLLAPLAFNILALYLGHSVLFIQDFSGTSWFNVRYGIMLMPSLAIYVGYLVHRLKDIRWTLVGTVFFLILFSVFSHDAVTVDDAVIGSSGKNVTQVSKWLEENTKNKKGFVMISVASHDAIIFSSNLPMVKFIHEGTGAYWTSATEAPDRWGRWIIMRTNDVTDLTFKEIQDAPGLVKYNLVQSFPFADIYELKEEYLNDLNTEPVYTNQK